MRQAHVRRLPLAGALAIVMVATLGVSGAIAQPPADPPSTEVSSPGVPVASYAVTLVTGDRVLVEELSHGQPAVTVDAAPRADGAGVTFQTYHDGESVYVLPSDAADWVPSVLDRELFNVSKLADYGYTDGVPVITTVESSGDRVMTTTSAAAAVATTDVGVTVTAELTSIGGHAATVHPDGDWWQEVSASLDTVQSTAPRPATTATDNVADGLPRVWLDEQVQVALSDSVELIGAPTAWDTGLDGTGVTVAVLDTGIDADHPDLTGQVAAARDFTGSDDPVDRHGHGTHVAGIIAGSGAASDGAYIGVAPGATLINGKVLDANGNGSESGIIAGMEWAAVQGADVVNMSLGRFGGDGTDPMSLALNRLTEQYGVLFTVAAGNDGPGDETLGSPGVADAALTVGSVDKQRRLANTSSRGPRWEDFAIKPDVTAPGVGIVSARAAGTTLNPPVGEHYVPLSGTSMATPHVAGAAALLLQQQPDLTPAQLKAQLISTAEPHPDYDAYQQGGGLIDVPAALATPVTIETTPLNLGYMPYPHDDVVPVTAEVVLRNHSDTALTVNLAVQARSREGATVGEQQLAVSPPILTIPAGSTATTTVTLDAEPLPYGLYHGSLTASLDGELVARAPLGFHKESERYNLTIIGIARDGRAARGDSGVGVLDVENMARLMRPGEFFTDGMVRLRVPPATYSVLGLIHTYDPQYQDIQQSVFVGDPEVSVTEDTTLVLDARDAEPIVVHAPQPDARPQGNIGLGYWRTAATPGPIFGTSYFGLPTGREYFAQSTDPVTLGGFELHTHWRMAAPEARLAVDGRLGGGFTLDPYLLRGPAVDGHHLVRLVDVGVGGAADYQGVDVTGAAVLVTRSDTSIVELEARAAAAGAAALILTNNVPGRYVGNLPTDFGSIPTLSISQAEGQQLRQRLETGAVRLRMSGTAWSPYLYNLLLLEVGQISTDLTYHVAPEHLARIDVAYHNDDPDHLMSEVRYFSRPYHASYHYLYPYVEGTQQRSEYVIAEGIAYQQVVYGELPFEARLQEPDYRTYQPGETVSTSWFRAAVRPALLPQVAPTQRQGDTLQLNVFEWVDDAGNHFPEVYGLAPYPGDTITTRIYQDGQQVAEATVPRDNFPMAPEAAEYRIELDVTRQADWWRTSTATRTVWTFSSAQAVSGPELLPLLSIDYDLAVDLTNTAPHPRDRKGPPTMYLQVSQQSLDLPEVTQAQVWISYDDGATWTPRPTWHRQDGRFEVRLDSRGANGTTGYASIRVEATDADGNRIEQEIIRAWRLWG